MLAGTRELENVIETLRRMLRWKGRTSALGFVSRIKVTIRFCRRISWKSGLPDVAWPHTVDMLDEMQSR